MIAHWPKGISAKGELRHTPAHLVDLVPTIMDVAGGKRFETWEGQPTPVPPGKALTAAFAKDVAVPRDSIWWLHEGNRALRVGDWKIVAAGAKSAWELYDLRTDRAESNDLAKKQPDRVKAMAELWSKQTEEFCALAAKDAPPAQKGRGGAKKRDDAE